MYRSINREQNVFIGFHMTDSTNVPDLLGHASRITAAYISHNKIELDEISSVVTRVLQALTDITRNPHNHKTGLARMPAGQLKTLFMRTTLCA